MSRQRIRSSVLESSTEKCSHCGGTGHVRSVSSVALQLLRSLEEMLLKGATHNLNVRTRSDIALYLLNHKRAHLRVLEERFRIAIMVNADATLGGQLSFVIEKGEQVHSLEQAKALALQPATAVPPIEEDEDEGDYEEEEDALDSEGAAASEEEEDAQGAGEEAQAAGEPGQGRRRRRRRRGRRGGEGREAFQHERDEFPREGSADFAPASGEHDDLARSGQAPEAGDGAVGGERPAEAHGEGERRRRRRGRRGGRRNRRGREGESFAPDGSPEPELASAVYDLDQPAPVAAAEPPVTPIAESEPRTVPIAEPRDDVQPPAETRPRETPSAQIAGPAPEPPAAEPPRRRSTVREPAPQALRDEASPPAPSFTPPASSIEPVESSPAESEDSDRPRRSGWWSKRVLGKS
jgi:ribonuclease E